VSEFSTPGFDEEDIFSDPRIVGTPKKAVVHPNLAPGQPVSLMLAWDVSPFPSDNRQLERY